MFARKHKRKKKEIFISMCVHLSSQSERLTRLFERIYSSSKHTTNNDAERDNREKRRKKGKYLALVLLLKLMNMDIYLF